MPDRLLTTAVAVDFLAAAEQAYLAGRFTTTPPGEPGPGPAYVDEDGTPLYPVDAVACDREQFVARFVGAGGDASEAETEWQWYAEGTYGMCLTAPSPESVAEKELLSNAIEALLRATRPDDVSWCDALREAVDRLDDIVAPFAPLDFVRFGAHPSRVRLIEDVRARFPEAFERAA